MGKKHTKDYWENHYRLFLESGLSQTEYCKQNEISFFSFNPWKRRLDKLKSNESIQEIPIKFTANKNRDERIEIILSNKIKISIPNNFSQTTLKQIILSMEDENANKLG